MSVHTNIVKKIELPIIGGLAVFLLLCTLAMPAIAGAATASTTISSQIGSIISAFSSNGTVNVNVIPTASGAQTIASDTLTVSTNNSTGYNLQIADTDTNTNLVSSGNNLAATTGTPASPVALVANKWGYRVDGAASFGAGPTSSANSAAIASTTFAGVPSSAAPFQIKSTSTTAASDTTTVWYSVAASTAQASGTYTDGVTYTATANP